MNTPKHPEIHISLSSISCTKYRGPILLGKVCNLLHKANFGDDVNAIYTAHYDSENFNDCLEVAKQYVTVEE